MMRCSVVFALPDREWEWEVELQDGATIAAAMELARQAADSSNNAPDVPWLTANVGIYGEVRSRETNLSDGDRVEIYRPLQVDPKESRRDRARRIRTRG